MRSWAVAASAPWPTRIGRLPSPTISKKSYTPSKRKLEDGIMAIRIGINGACGRMGQRILQLAREDPEVAIGAALEDSKHPRQGADAGDVAGLGHIGVPIISELPINSHLNVLIDFSLPEGTLSVLPVCVARRIPIVVATTGHSRAQK